MQQRGQKLCVTCNSHTRIAECAGCHALLYCSQGCAQIDWNAGHSAKCVPVRCASVGCGDGFSDLNLDDTTARNAHYRQVLYTTDTQQLVVMHLRPGEDVGTEVHPETTQFVRVVRGSGEAMMGRGLSQLSEGSAIMVPPGVRHNVWASKDGQGLWFYTLYSPPEHPVDTLQERKPP
jgi:mannose-6-phosphate isomerase-like protein (cupin superfamily)